MRIPIDPEGASGGPFSELLRLQSDFYARLTQETLRYLRHLQGAAAPAVPGTVLLPSAAIRLDATGSPGGLVELRLEVENRQRMHCVVTASISPLVDPSGITWFPESEAASATLLLAPEEVAVLVVKITLPANIPSGAYHGALLLQGFRDGAIAVTITVAGNETKGAEAAPGFSATTQEATPASKGRGRRTGGEAPAAAPEESKPRARRKS